MRRQRPGSGRRRGSLRDLWCMSAARKAPAVGATEEVEEEGVTAVRCMLRRHVVAGTDGKGDGRTLGGICALGNYRWCSRSSGHRVSACAPLCMCVHTGSPDIAWSVVGSQWRLLGAPVGDAGNPGDCRGATPLAVLHSVACRLSQARSVYRTLSIRGSLRVHCNVDVCPVSAL